MDDEDELLEGDDTLMLPEGEMERLPDGFFSDDATDEDLQKVANIRKAVGRPLDQLFATVEQIKQRGEAGQLRGIRFASPADALIWLYTTAIFHFSNVVDMGNGLWGVRVGTSDKAPSGEVQIDDGSDLVF